MSIMAPGVRRAGLAAVAAGLLVPFAAHPAVASSSSTKPMTMAAACSQSSDSTTSSNAVLGAGVSLSTDQQGNLFPRGATSQLHVSAPSSGASTQQVRLQVRDQTAQVGVRSASVSRAPKRASAVPASRPVGVPDRPGWYQVRAERVSGGKVVGVSCLWYGVAMHDSSLDLDTLPAGKDWGGPGPLRDVALSAQLGLNVVRYQLSVADFLSNPHYADPDLTAAARRASALGMRFVVQIGQGAADETAAVKKGTWGHLVRRIASAYPAVRYWSPWNEPNSGEFFYGSTRTYVRRVLRPTVKAVHAISPRAKVVGGDAIGDDPGWWKRFAALGGFRDADAIGVHPYTSNLGAPESAGLLSVLRLVHHLAATHRAARKPILDTESAWPSSYPNVHADLATQADYVSRKYVLERTLGVSPGEYLLEGGYQDWDVIDYFRGVKPAALALSAASTLLAHRHFVGWVHTGRSHVWAARFSGRHGKQLIALWSSAGSCRLHLRGSRTGFGSFGAHRSFHGHVRATGALSFLTVPAGWHGLS